MENYIKESQEFKNWCKEHNFEPSKDISLKLWLMFTKEKAVANDDNSVICQVCGKAYKHLIVAHSISLKSYVKMFPNAKTVAPNYAKAMRESALEKDLSKHIKPYMIKEKK